MQSPSRALLAAGLVLALLPCPALPCNLCVNIRQSPTFRQEANAATARLILHGYLENPRLRSDLAGAGTTDFRIVEVLKADAGLAPSQQKKKGDVLVLPTYVPIEDVKNPPHYLLFCDVNRQGIDPYRPVLISSPRAADYVREALSLPLTDVRRSLQFYFRYLDHPDKQISTDAFMEFAHASDQEIGRLGKSLYPDKLRAWLKDPHTPEERLGLYAFLLGACGTRDDLAWFQHVLAKPGERLMSAYDGLLGGFIQLRPVEGWALAEKMLRDGKQPLPVRLAIVRTLRFYMGWKPLECRQVVFRCQAGIVTQGELADLAAEDLRRWQMWELTDSVLALYARPGLDAPIHRRAILRYALSCPKPEAKSFIAAVRQREGDTVREVEESMRAFDR